MCAKWVSLAVIAALWVSQSASGQDGYCDACQQCDCGPSGHHAAHCAAKRAEMYANCGCNGSYKFPVPPLYTYHWPGMYQQVRMTDYHSPWRFPPLKPYVDEVAPEIIGGAKRFGTLQPVSLTIKTTNSEQPLSFSDRVERLR
jgi:hypothetical protein